MGERQEGGESYSEVVSSRAGAAGSGVGGVAARPAAVASCGGGAPAWKEGRGKVGEVHWTMRKLYWGSIWIEEGRSRGFRGERAAGGVHDGGKGVL